MAIVSHNAARLLEVLLAVPSSGRVAVPINFRLSPEEVEYIVGHCGARVLLVDPELEPTLKSVRPSTGSARGRSTSSCSATTSSRGPWAAPDEDATATINYTSGTTARPKGVQMTHRNLWVNAVTFGMHMQVSDRDVYLHTLPMFHCNGWGLPYTMAGLGARQVVLRKVDGAEILRRVEEHGVTIMAGRAGGVERRAGGRRRLGRPDPRAATRCASSSPARRRRRRPSPASRPSWAGSSTRSTASPRPRRCSPSTGPAPSTTTSRPEERAKQLSRAGVPALGTRMSVSESGEVLAQGNTVLAGYWENPDASAEALEGGWFHTGDGGTIDDGGYLTISDRKKDVIITGGENVSSIEVEDAVFSHPAVAEVAVIGVPDDKWGEMVTAIVVVAEGEQVTEADIIAHCRGKIAGYKIPKRVEFRDELARTATGKIQKFKLRESFWEGSERQVN